MQPSLILWGFADTRNNRNEIYYILCRCSVIGIDRSCTRVGVYIGNLVPFRSIVPPVKRWEVKMKEKTLERKLVQAVKAIGGLAPKFVSPGLDGVPDRLILLPSGRIAFTEVKTTGCKPRPLQLKRKGQLEALGFSVYVIDHPDQIGGMLDEIRAI